MSITYVNIGGTKCASFSESKPADIPNIILYTGSSVLKATNFSIVTIPTPGNVTNLGSNALVSSDFQFTARFVDSVVFSSPPRPNARVLFKTGSAPDNTKFGESTNWTDNQNVTIYDGTSYTLKINDESPLNNLLGDSLPTLNGQTVQTGASFYLRKYTPTGSTPSLTDKIYLTRDLTVKDIETLGVVASDITNKETFKFVIKTDANTGRKFFGIQRSDNSVDLPTLVVVYDSTKTPNYYVLRGGDNDYFCIDTLEPSEAVPTTEVITLIKNTNNGKFLSLDTTGITSSSFIFSDYWTSGLTSQQIQERIMFRWIDLTPNSPINPSLGSTEDIYHWGILNTSTAMAGRYINVYSAANGSLIVGNTSTRPPLNEGWAFSFLGSDTKGALVYRKADTELGYMDPGNGTPTFVQLSAGGSIPTTANVFTCVKCSNTDPSTRLCTP